VPGQPVKIGPWPGGLNLRDSPRNIEDNELAACLNFDITDEGILRPRRPLMQGNDIGSGHKYLMGSVNKDNGDLAAISSKYDGTNSVFYETVNGINYNTVFGGTARLGIFRSIIQYNNRLWVIDAAFGTGAFADNLTSALTDIPSMPFGDFAFMLKDRMFIVWYSGNRIYYSKPTDPTVWTSPDGGFFDVNPGDGQNITKVISLNNQIFIFKRNSTYIFSFNADPANDGSLRQVSPNQGAFDAVAYNNEIYVVNDRSVFKFINGYFVDIASKIDLYRNTLLDLNVSNELKISLLNNTLLVGHTMRGDINPLLSWFAMNLNTGAWSEYYFYEGNFSIGETLMNRPIGATIFCRSENKTRIIFGDNTQFTKLPYMDLIYPNRTLDQDNANAARYPTYNFSTKTLNMGDNAIWKKIFSWAVETVYPHKPTVDPTNTTLIIVDDVFSIFENNTFDDLNDKINTRSSRFRRLTFKWNAHKTAGNIHKLTSAPAFPDERVYAPTVYSITAWINTKAPITK
jgi:hypothetical protein